MKTLSRVRWGIIGVGDVTERKSGPGFQQAERSELVAVMRRSGDLAADYAARHGVPRWYDDADALINDAEVDAVYVATRPDTHCDYALKIAAAGKPIYMEKPMARTAAECEEMIKAAELTGVPLFVAYYRRAMPRFVMIKELLESGRVGELRTVSIRSEKLATEAGLAELPWRVVPEISGGGHFVDLGSHILDLLDWLLGPITEVAGGAVNRGGHYRAEDIVTATLGFGSGVEGIGVWNYDSFEDRDEIEIVGTKASVTFSCFGQEPVRLKTADDQQLIPAPYPEVVQLPLIQQVVDALTGTGESSSTAQSALRTSKIIDRLLADYRQLRA